jgi:septation ring formation regulator EzrA
VDAEEFVDAQYEARELREKLERSSAAFIATELQLASTFLTIARTTEDSQKSERNLQHARKAFESAKKYVERMKSSGSTFPADIDERLSEIDQQLIRALSLSTKRT